MKHRTTGYFPCRTMLEMWVIDLHEMCLGIKQTDITDICGISPALVGTILKQHGWFNRRYYGHLDKREFD